MNEPDNHEIDRLNDDGAPHTEAMETPRLCACEHPAETHTDGGYCGFQFADGSFCGCDRFRPVMQVPYGLKELA